MQVYACALTLFLCGEISSLIRAHLLRVFNLLQVQTHVRNKQALKVKAPRPSLENKTLPEGKEKGGKTEQVEEQDNRGRWGATSLANELLKDNPLEQREEPDKQ